LSRSFARAGVTHSYEAARLAQARRAQTFHMLDADSIGHDANGEPRPVRPLRAEKSARPAREHRAEVGGAVRTRRADQRARLRERNPPFARSADYGVWPNPPYANYTFV
jgi:hypothetical protein